MTGSKNKQNSRIHLLITSKMFPMFSIMILMYGSTNLFSSVQQHENELSAI